MPTDSRPTASASKASGHCSGYQRSSSILFINSSSIRSSRGLGVEDALVEGDVGPNAANDRFGERPPHPRDRLFPRVAVREELRNHRVVVRRDHIAAVHVRVHTDAGPARHALRQVELDRDRVTDRVRGREDLCNARIDAHKMRRGNLDENDWQELPLAADRLSSSPIFIDDTPGLSVLDGLGNGLGYALVIVAACGGTAIVDPPDGAGGVRSRRAGGERVGGGAPRLDHG